MVKQCKVVSFIALILSALLCQVIAASIKNEGLEEKLLNRTGAEKIELIIEYVGKNRQFNAASAEYYIEVGSELLTRFPDHEQHARLLRHAARIKILQERFENAEQLANRALTYAEKSQVVKTILIVKLTLGDIYQRQELFNKAELIFLQALEDSKQHSLNDITADVHILLGDLFRRQANLTLALSHYLQALEWSKSQEDHIETSRIYALIAGIYRRMGIHDKMLSYQQQSIDMARELNYQRGLAIRLGNMGTFYKDVGAYEESIKVLEESIELKEHLGYPAGVLYSVNLLAEVYRLMGNVTQAQQNLDRALKLEAEITRPSQRALTQVYLGRLYMDIGELDKAKSVLHTSVQLFKENFQRYGEVYAYHDLAKLYIKLNDDEQAIHFLNKAIEFGQLGDTEHLLLDVFQDMAALYEKRSNYKAAYQYITSFTELKQRLDAINNKNIIDALLVEYNVAEKNRQIEALEKESELAALDLENKSNEQKITIISAILSVLCLGFFLYWRSKSAQLALEKATIKKVSEANKRLNLALWGSGEELWDWDLVSGYMTREHQNSDIKLPVNNVGASIEVVKGAVHPDDFIELSQKFNDHLAGKSDFFEASYRLLTQTGDWLWVLDRGKVTARDEKGNALRIIGTMRNISDIKKVELALAEINETLEQRVLERTEELKQSRDELVLTLEELTTTQANLVEARKMASLGRLVAGVSHELNTPLGTSVTASSMLKEELHSFSEKVSSNRLSKTEVQQFMDVTLNSSYLLDRNIARAAELVQRFKQVSVDEKMAKSEQINLFHHLTSFVSSHNKNEKVTIHLDCATDLCLWSDPYLLDAVLDGLFENTISHGFTDDELNGNIWIKVSLKDSEIELCFCDDGKGVNPENEADLYEPFFTTKRGEGKVGLGLYVVFTQVTHLLKGNIHFQARQAGGACFIITIPAER